MTEGDVSLRDYLESLFEEHRRMHEELAKGITVALASVDARLQSMNEFRASLDDVVRNTVSRDTWEQGRQQSEQRLEAFAADLRDRLDLGLATANKHVDRDLFDQRAALVDDRITALETSQDIRIKALENWRSRAAGAAIVLSLFAGVLGAAVVRALGGG
jgi:hypothetical protein